MAQKGIVGLETDSVLFNINSTNYTTQAKGTGFGGRKISDMTDAELKELANIIDEKFKSKKVPKDGKQGASREHLADRNAIKLEQKRRKQKPEPETVTPQKPIKEQIKERFGALKGFGINESDTEIRINKSSTDISKFERGDVLQLIEDYADATGKRVVLSGGVLSSLQDVIKRQDYEESGRGLVRLPKAKERPELDVGQPLDPVPEEKFDEPELSLVEQEINEANVIKFITQKFNHIFNSDLLALGGTKLRVQFVSKAPQGTNFIASYRYAESPFQQDYDQVLSDRDHTIVFYVDRLMSEKDGTRGITTTVRHELMHAIGRVAAAKRNKGVSNIYEEISKSLTPAQRDLMDELYGGKGYQYGSGQHRGRGAEFFRAVMEEFLYGIPSEESSRRKQILKSGTAFQKVVVLVKDIQRYIANFFKADVLKNPEVATLFIDSVNLMTQLDSKARPVNQKLVDLVRSRISPNTDTLYDNVNDYTKDMKEYVDEQLAQDEGKKVKHEELPKGNTVKGMSFASRYLIPVGQLLANIHPDLEKAFHKYIQVKDEKILVRHRMARPFSEKMKALKKSNERDYIKLWALIYLVQMLRNQDIVQMSKTNSLKNEMRYSRSTECTMSI